jgi:hypothetical protein
MTYENRELLNRASGILEGISVSENLTQAETDLIITAVQMIDKVLEEEKTK